MARTRSKTGSKQKPAVATASGLRGLTSGIVGTLLANQVRASAGKASIAGVAAGVAFNMMLKRSPVGALLFGGALIARQALKKSKATQARHDAGKALGKGALAAPPAPAPAIVSASPPSPTDKGVQPIPVGAT